MASVHYPRTFQGFLNWKPETRYKYEWNKGKIEKTDKMKQLEFFILKALSRLFVKTNAYQNGAELLTEGDVLTSSEQLRRPDLAYYTESQIIETTKGINQVPTFVIEIISPSDNQNKILEKNQEYFLAGVQLIWLIMPNLKQVHIYSSPKKVHICTDDDICSAKPVLPDFEISVNNLLTFPS
ncbi:Uma2 family endonuclease [Emticicia sp.]|uniref:Uma2 family endonuclease n=1 Tax=Emticicia sp. TaxID=1930953 RepID=UPI003751370E